MASLPAIPPLGPHAVVRGWGGIAVPAFERLGEDLAAVTEGAVLTRGLGRSYGDASLPPPSVRWLASSRLADRMLSFDPSTGDLRAEAGLSLDTLIRVFLPKGWFPPVSPGTWFVTLGGMVASDVHGKNHHVAGTIGRYVQAVTLRVASGDLVTCSREQHADLFFATIGGMGLTGHILDVTLRLEPVPSRWIWRQSIQKRDFDDLVDGLGRSSDWPQTACWIDTLATGASMGRGLLVRGRWATATEAPPQMPGDPLSPTVPFQAPAWTLNDLSMRAFNLFWFHKQLWSHVQGLVSPRSWFAPLDGILEWRRAYGKRGFTQHQCVIPREAGAEAVRAYCALLARRGGTGFLCVLKDCGEEGEGLLSFPRPGVSFALDLPMRSDTQDLVDQLNAFVIETGGRIYLTKDALTRPEHLRRMEGARIDRFQEVRHRWDPNLTIRSAMSVRLLGDPP